jgi:hypothetical protein
MHPLHERGRVEKKGEYEGLFPKRIKQESLSQWKYEGMELVSRVLTLPENEWWLYAR